MAKHLPCPSAERTRVTGHADQQDIQNAADNTRLRRLKEWRHGTVPKSDQLTDFLESLTGNHYGAFFPLIMTRVATIWTKWIEQERFQLDQLVNEAPALEEHLNFEWFMERFSRYPEYWTHTKAQATSGDPGP